MPIYSLGPGYETELPAAGDYWIAPDATVVGSNEEKVAAFFQYANDWSLTSFQHFRNFAFELCVLLF